MTLPLGTAALDLSKALTLNPQFSHCFSLDFSAAAMWQPQALHVTTLSTGKVLGV